MSALTILLCKVTIPYSGGSVTGLSYTPFRGQCPIKPMQPVTYLLRLIIQSNRSSNANKVFLVLRSEAMLRRVVYEPIFFRFFRLHNTWQKKKEKISFTTNGINCQRAISAEGGFIVPSPYILTSP